MSQHEKLLKRFLAFPKDFTWEELKKPYQMKDTFDFLGKIGVIQVEKRKETEINDKNGKNDE